MANWIKSNLHIQDAERFESLELEFKPQHAAVLEFIAINLSSVPHLYLDAIGIRLSNEIDC